MTFHPTSIYKVVSVHSIDQVAIGRRLGHSDATLYLFTGGAEPLMMPLAGERAGHAYNPKQAGQASFLIVDELEFEVDPGSYYRPAHVEEPMGALLVTDAGMGLTAYVKQGNWPGEITDVYFNDQGDGASRPTQDRAGFKKWRAIKRVGDELIEIAVFACEAKADR